MVEDPESFNIDLKLYNQKKRLKPLLITKSSYSQQFFIENEFIKNDKLHNKIILGQSEKSAKFKQMYPDFENLTKSEYSLTFDGIEKTDIKSVVDYAENTIKSKFTLLELPFETIASTYKNREVYESNPIDTIFLALYSGIGVKYEPGVKNSTSFDFSELLKEYHPINYSNIIKDTRDPKQYWQFVFIFAPLNN